MDEVVAVTPTAKRPGQYDHSPGTTEGKAMPLAPLLFIWKVGIYSIGSQLVD